METLTTSREEPDRITIMVGIQQGELTLRAAAPVLGLISPQPQRVWHRYQVNGDAGLVHRARGRPGARRTPPTLRARILARYRERLTWPFDQTCAVVLEMEQGQTLRPRSPWGLFSRRRNSGQCLPRLTVNRPTRWLQPRHESRAT